MSKSLFLLKLLVGNFKNYRYILKKVFLKLGSNEARACVFTFLHCLPFSQSSTRSRDPVCMSWTALEGLFSLSLSVCSQCTWSPPGEAGLILPIPLPPLAAKTLQSSAVLACAKVSPCQLLPVERDAGGRHGGWVLAQSHCRVFWVAVGGEGGAWSRATCPLLPSELELEILQGPYFTHESAFPPAATFTPSVQQPRPLSSPDGSPASFLSHCLATPRPAFQALSHSHSSPSLGAWMLLQLCP